MNKKGISSKIWKAVLIAWIVFSAAYIFYTEWKKFKLETVRASYEQGRTDAVNQVIIEAQKCKPFPVYSGETEVNLLSIECVQQAQAADQAGQKQTVFPQDKTTNGGEDK